MSTINFPDFIDGQLRQLRREGLYKTERQLQSPQGVTIRVQGNEVINFCANNYLGLANHPAIIAAAEEGLARYGYGMASVRFICGTHELHRELENAIAKFLGKDDAILYTSCFDANTGLFETLLTEEDTVLSDELNHASIIDGIRLCKAQRYRFRHSDMSDLERGLKAAVTSRFRLIATDGVFSMDGDLARLPEICELAERYDGLVMVDDSHATGVLGTRGRGTGEHFGLMDQITILTSTLGKAWGGAAGGFTCAKAGIIDYLRQRSRPYLFSNALPPVVTMAALKALEMIENGNDLRDRLHSNAIKLRTGFELAGLKIKPGKHPIIPVMVGDASLATAMADKLLDHGIYVVGFSFPVVPQGQARIRIQVSSAHSTGHLQSAISAFASSGKELKLI